MGAFRRVRMTDAAAALLDRLLRRRTTSDGLIHVVDTPDHIHIGLRDVGGRRSPMVSRPAGVIQVQLFFQGGSDGTPTALPEYEYMARRLDDPSTAGVIGTNMRPEWRFTEVGTYVPAPPGSLGEAYKLDDEWHLLFAYEERKRCTLCDPYGEK